MPYSEDATVTSKGQVTIPKQIRDRLGIESGTRLTFVVEDGGVVRMYPKKQPTERLREVKQKLADCDTDVDQLRQQAKREWESG